MSPAEVVQIDDEEDETLNRIKSLHDRLAATRKRFKLTKENDKESMIPVALQPSKEETPPDNNEPSKGMQDVRIKTGALREDKTGTQNPIPPSTSGQGDATPVLKKAMSFTGKEIINLEPDSPPTKDELRKFINLFLPVLKDVPDWVTGRYLEFKDDRIRLCSRCKSACEWIFFQPLKTKKELCAGCLKIEGCSSEEAQIFVREGVSDYLNALDGAAINLLPDQQK